MKRLDEDTNTNLIDKRVVLGIILVIIGAVLLGINFGIISNEIKYYIFSWEMLLIVIGAILLTKRDNSIPGLILIAVGSIFLLPDILDIPLETRKLFWPAVIIALGLIMVFKKKGSLSFKQNVDIQDDDILNESPGTNVIDDLSMFGGAEKYIKSDNFRGGRITAIFGGSEYNMLSVNLAPKCFIDLFIVFGGVKLVVPSDWNIRVETITIFGGFSDKRSKLPQLNVDAQKEIVLKGLVLFGGGEIRSFISV